jgi:putative FmdB family regulatory protein
MNLVFLLAHGGGFPLGPPGGGRGRLSLVPRYEFRCRACGDTFLVTRPMSESGAPAACPQGHDDTVKLLSTVAVGGRASGPGTPPAALGGGGGCCGGACGCG